MLRLSGSRLPGRPPERSARDRPAEPARVGEDEDERHAETHRKSKQVEAPFGPDHEESEGRDEDEGCGQPSLTDEGGGERGNDREQEREAGADEEVRGQVVEVIRVGAPRRPAVGTDRGALQYIDGGLSLQTRRRALEPVARGEAVILGEC